MDGLTFLEKLMHHFPMPVVIVSSLTPKNSENSFRALELGAVEVISKPGSQYSTPDVHGQLVRAIRAAASSNMDQMAVRTAPPVSRPATFNQLSTTHQILAIGASTGGTRAIEEVLLNLPANTPGAVIVQHMPEGFTDPFARRLNQLCAMEVREAVNGEEVAPGVALLSPGNVHMVLKRSGARFYVQLKDGPLVHYQRPAVDVLFNSVAQSAGKNAVGVILTGMGADGATGLLAMKNAGARTIAQDEKTCVVFGMPKEAIALGAAEKILPLTKIAPAVVELLSGKIARN
jgi:two-component system chemotaxis response regulator CheB